MSTSNDTPEVPPSSHANSNYQRKTGKRSSQQRYMLNFSSTGQSFPPQSRDDESTSRVKSAESEPFSPVYLTPITSNHGFDAELKTQQLSVTSRTQENPLSNNAKGNENISHRSTPVPTIRSSSPRRALQLDLPPPVKFRTSNSSPHNDSSTSNGEVPRLKSDHDSSAVARSSYLTRKAHHFSSMKKSKQNGGTDRVAQPTPQLLNRLFCTVPTALKDDEGAVHESSLHIDVSSSSSSDNDIDTRIYLRSDNRGTMKSVLEMSSINAQDGGLNSRNSDIISGGSNSPTYGMHPKTTKSLSVTDSLSVKGVENRSASSESSYVATFSGALQQASENIAIETETRLRRSIHNSLQDTILGVCLQVSNTGSVTPASHHSPPTYLELTSDHCNSGKLRNGNYFFLDENHYLKGLETREANEESTEVELKEPFLRKKRIFLSSLEEAASPKQDESLISPQSADTKLTPSLSITPTDATVIGLVDKKTSVSSSEDVEKHASKRTPGKVVIPAQFLSHGNRSIPDQIFTKQISSSLDQTQTQEKLCLKSGSLSGTETNSVSSLSRSVCSDTDAKGEKQTRPRDQSSFASQFGDSVTEARREHQSQPKDQSTVASQFGVTRVEMVRASRGFSPPPMVRLVSSLEDLATVQEASSSMETATINTKESSENAGIKFSFDIGMSHEDDRHENTEFLNDPQLKIQHEDPYLRTNEKTTDTDSPSHLTDTIDTQKQESEKKVLIQTDVTTQNNSFQAESLIYKDVIPQNDSFQAEGEQNEALQSLKAQYDRRVRELKDQTILANRLAKLRLDEVERMELELKKHKGEMSLVLAGKIAEESEKVRKEADLESQALRKELEVLREECRMKHEAEKLSGLHEAELNHIRHEYEKLSWQLREKESESSATAKENQRILRELVDVKEKIAVKDKERRTKERGELNRLRKELAEVKQTLEATKKLERSKTPTKEIQRLQKELSIVKKELETKEKEEEKRESEELLQVRAELERVRKQVEELKSDAKISRNESEHSTGDITLPLTPAKNNSEQQKEPDSMKVDSPASKSSPTFGRLGRVIKSSHRMNRVRLSSGSNQSNDQSRDNQLELFEREKESLQKQIELLNQQASKASQEHETALQELREASEREIQLIKQDMENRLSHHLNRERGLKESLSLVSSREKMELLEQIELLESEKKQERNGGLREVQRKEDLLLKISLLEKKQKEMAEDHEHALQQLRQQSDNEIQRMRQDMKQNAEEQAARERDLQAALSDTGSYEKEELLEKLEKVQNQLDNERSCAVLLKIKVTNFDKDLTTLKSDHAKALELMAKEKEDEITKLKSKLNESRIMEDRLSNVTNENQKLAKELEANVKTRNETIEKIEREFKHQIKSLEDKLAAEKSFASNEKQSMDRFLSQTEKSQKEFIEKIKREKDNQIKQLKAELEERKGLEEAMLTTCNENNALKEELELVERKFDLEQQRRQRIIDELRKEHAQTEASLKQSSIDRINLAQKEWSERQLLIQQKIDAEHSNQLKQIMDEVDVLRKVLIDKDEDLSKTRAEVTQKSLKERTELLEKIQSLTEEVNALKKRILDQQIAGSKKLQDKEDDFRSRLQAVEQTFFDDKQRLQDEVESLKLKHDQLEAKTEEKFRKKMKSQELKFSYEKKRLLDQIDAMKAQQKDEGQSNESRLREKEIEVRQELLIMEEKFCMEKNDILNQLQTEKMLRSQGQESLDKLKSDLTNAHDKFLGEKILLNQQIESLNLQIRNEKSKLDQIIQDHKIEVSKQLEIADLKFDSERTKFKAEIEQEQVSKKELEDSMGDVISARLKEVEQTFAKEKQELQDQICLLQSLQNENDARIKQIQQEHTMELDELLSQLDLVEAEHQEFINKKERSILEKEGIISALTAQLTEAQRRTSSIDVEKSEQLVSLEKQKERTKLAEEALLSCKEEIKALKDLFQKFTKEAELKQAKACEAAREEMIERAELQFKQANEHYVKLRKQFEASQAYVTKLENRLKESSKKADALLKEKESCEALLKSEISQLKAAKAKTETDATQMARDYRREMDRLIETTKDYEAKVHESETTSRNIQTTLATVVFEKEKLQKEYEEMKSVSEELMAIVEGLQRTES